MGELIAPDDGDRDEDLGFGGWRDWLVLLVFGPIFLATLVGAALLGIGARGNGPVGLSGVEALVVVAVAVVGGLLAHRLRRRWRS